MKLQKKGRVWRWEKIDQIRYPLDRKSDQVVGESWHGTLHAAETASRATID
jgi:hypothetical protein